MFLLCPAYLPGVKKKTSQYPSLNSILPINFMMENLKHRENGQKVKDQWREIGTNAHCLTSLVLQLMWFYENFEY